MGGWCKAALLHGTLSHQTSTDCRQCRAVGTNTYELRCEGIYYAGARCFEERAARLVAKYEERNASQTYATRTIVTRRCAQKRTGKCMLQNNLSPQPRPPLQPLAPASATNGHGKDNVAVALAGLAIRKGPAEPQQARAHDDNYIDDDVDLEDDGSTTTRSPPTRPMPPLPKAPQTTAPGPPPTLKQPRPPPHTRTKPKAQPEKEKEEQTESHLAGVAVQDFRTCPNHLNNLVK